MLHFYVHFSLYFAFKELISKVFLFQSLGLWERPKKVNKSVCPSVRSSVDSHSEISLISQSAFQKLFMPSLLKIQNKVQMSKVKMSKVNNVKSQYV